MPTYQYRCKDCGSDLEVQQKFTDDALTECPNCDGGQLRKVYNAVGVHFKGSGFYRTDSRKDAGAKSSSGGSSSGEKKSDSPSRADSGSGGSGSSGSSSSDSKSSSSKAATSA
ncbi:FmdB family transcriptional regulator [Enemella evansiae]|uniref:FmdB family zinc ribbon protein n=1 Tax=Enemella evansiae TaxID=2016499 RepID=UPI000B978FF2|nr:FmdB family zinc ribbon protein [Enemella evansiae]OYO07772.1 FmdB family transcriptional regulator [Enemella evansiae]